MTKGRESCRLREYPSPEDCLALGLIMIMNETQNLSKNSLLLLLRFPERTKEHFTQLVLDTAPFLS